MDSRILVAFHVCKVLSRAASCPSTFGFEFLDYSFGVSTDDVDGGLIGDSPRAKSCWKFVHNFTEKTTTTIVKEQREIKRKKRPTLPREHRLLRQRGELSTLARVEKGSSSHHWCLEASSQSIGLLKIELEDSAGSGRLQGTSTKIGDWRWLGYGHKSQPQRKTRQGVAMIRNKRL